MSSDALRQQPSHDATDRDEAERRFRAALDRLAPTGLPVSLFTKRGRS